MNRLQSAGGPRAQATVSENAEQFTWGILAMRALLFLDF